MIPFLQLTIHSPVDRKYYQLYLPVCYHKADLDSLYENLALRHDRVRAIITRGI